MRDLPIWGVAFVGLGSLVVIIGSLAFGAGNKANEHRAWREKCVNLGGVPFEPKFDRICFNKQLTIKVDE